MGYNGKSRKDKSEESKSRIVETALRLIDEKGFDKVSVSEITKEAGVSKGAFYIHFASKEDLIEQQIAVCYDEFKLDESKPRFERLSYFLTQSIKTIKAAGLKMCQEWFSHSVKGSYVGKRKFDYDREAIRDICGEVALAEEVITVYYGALNMWCFTEGSISPEDVVLNYLQSIKEKLS